LALAATTALSLRVSVDHDLPFTPDDLAERLGLEYRRVAVMKSPDRDQWTTAFLTPTGDELIVKIGSGSSAASIESEYQTQRRFVGYQGRFSVPVPHRLVKDADWSAFVMERVHPVLRPPDFDIEQALTLAVELSRFDEIGITHGDLAPWNIIDSYSTWLIDWERAKPFVPGADLAHYIFASAIIGRIIPVRDIPRYLQADSPTMREYALGSGADIAAVRAGILAEGESFLSRHPDTELAGMLESFFE
jgi:hypothetical protein